MGIFDALFHKADINTYIAEYKETPGAFLIDVRTGPEYEAGHIEGSINVPLHSIHLRTFFSAIQHSVNLTSQSLAIQS